MAPMAPMAMLKDFAAEDLTTDGFSTGRQL
jgi:hypothetical protein